MCAHDGVRNGACDCSEHSFEHVTKIAGLGPVAWSDQACTGVESWTPSYSVEQPYAVEINDKEHNDFNLLDFEAKAHVDDGNTRFQDSVHVDDVKKYNFKTIIRTSQSLEADVISSASGVADTERVNATVVHGPRAWSMETGTADKRCKGPVERIMSTNHKSADYDGKAERRKNVGQLYAQCDNDITGPASIFRIGKKGSKYNSVDSKTLEEDRIKRDFRKASVIPEYDDRQPDRLLVENIVTDIDDIISGHELTTKAVYNPPHTPSSYRMVLDGFWPTSTDIWNKYPEFRRIYDEVRETALPNHIGARRPLVSGLNIAAWRLMLTEYHDLQLVDYLEYGWPADYTADHPPVSAKDNHKESQDHAVHIKKYVDKELECGALYGPFDEPPFRPWTQFSPLMTRPKRNSEARRVIVDLSFPGAQSVNAGIRRAQYQGKPYTYTLPGIMDLADEVARLGRGCYVWCADLARAYRQLRTCPLSTPLLGIMFGNKFYVDAAPPFGCRTSSMACARTTGAVVYLLRKRRHFALCYLDDFVGAAATHAEALRAYQDLLDITSRLGLELSLPKCVPPTKELEWLGFFITTIHMRVEIPTEKLSEVLDECELWPIGRKASRKELQRLVGRLQHVAKCVRPARRFMNRILSALRRAPFMGRHKVPDEMAMDIKWFGQYAEAANGRVLIQTQEKIVWTIECDSSLLGGGAHSDTHYYSVIYGDDIRRMGVPIAQLEAMNLVMALRHLMPHNPEKYLILINTDNTASQSVLESGTGRDPTLCACAREVWLIAALHSTEVQIKHKPGVELVLADALSRMNHEAMAARTAQTILEKRQLLRVMPDTDDVFKKLIE